jgi:predicted amidophosphoribosyltransferase
VLQERDAELAEVERLLRMEQGGVAGNCPSCAAPHSRGALYCWQCGTTLMERQPSAAAGEQDGATSVMGALLAHQAAPGSQHAASSDE